MTTDPARARLVRARDQALADIHDLERQVAEAEIEPKRARRLRDRYEAEAAMAMAGLEGTADAPTPRSRNRAWIGTGIFVAAAALVTISIVATVEEPASGGIAAGGDGPSAAETSSNLDEVTNEQLEAVVAANPDVTPMRLALARRYLEHGDFSSALDHYMYVLERDTNPEALMYVGWMTYLSGDAATGAALLEESLRISPENVEAKWFLANALYDGLGDVEAARPLLEAVIDSGIAPDDVVDAATEMLGGT